MQWTLTNLTRRTMPFIIVGHLYRRTGVYRATTSSLSRPIVFTRRRRFYRYRFRSGRPA